MTHTQNDQGAEGRTRDNFNVDSTVNYLSVYTQEVSEIRTIKERQIK